MRGPLKISSRQGARLGTAPHFAEASRSQILGDWGTTRLRLFRMESGAIIDRIDGPGIGHLSASPADELAAALQPWRETAQRSGVYLCGMAGSRNGLIEAPYVSCPVPLKDWNSKATRIEVNGISVSVAAGLSCGNFAGRADVMRGEETQIFGAIARHPSFAKKSAILVLPGTHSKWVQLIDGRIERFHTFPTGELFALLTEQSTLACSKSSLTNHAWGFAEGIERTGVGLLAGVFEARAAQLTQGRDSSWAMGLLSGLLIGREFVDALALLKIKSTRITLIGEPALTTYYADAAKQFGLSASQLEGDRCTISGLSLLDTQA